MNGDISAISVTERRCAAPISYLESRVSDRSSYYMYTSSLRSKRFRASFVQKTGTRAKKGMKGEGEGSEAPTFAPFAL